MASLLCFLGDCPASALSILAHGFVIRWDWPLLATTVMELPEAGPARLQLLSDMLYQTHCFGPCHPSKNCSGVSELCISYA